jgi:outer membrane protein assembly factor BamE (lipoprotein component of BamABCDE complex)
MSELALKNPLRWCDFRIVRKCWRAILPLAVAVLIVVLATLNVGESLRVWLLGEATVYAEGYSERRFASIKVGTTTAEILSILGPPLRRGEWGDDPQVWFYTDQRTVTDNFWRRWLVLDPAGDRVAEIIADFWVD